MRSAIGAILAVVVGLVLANMLGVASAEAPTSAPVRTVSVVGVAKVPIAQEANVEAADAAYRQGMAAAIADGQGKAEFLASKTSTTLGGVQNVVEDGGGIDCTQQAGEGENEGSGYAPYKGEQPDFGSVSDVSAPLVRKFAAGAPRAAKGRPAKKRTRAKKAVNGVVCTLDARVSLVYVLD